MKIGNIELKNNIILAPMAGVTDMPFRILCKEQGCGLVYSEMVSAKGMHYNDSKTQNLICIDEFERPVSVQIFGSDENIMASTAYNLSNKKVDIIDINMGCPTPKITKNGEGVALMRNPEKVEKIIKNVVKSTDKPVTVKFRLGWDFDTINVLELSKIAEQSGISAIAIHGRTREMFYSGIANWEIIKKVKENILVPIIGNGDIRNLDDAKRIIELTNCDGIMIGRAAQGNPWIFAEIESGLKGKKFEAPSFFEKKKTIIRHLEMLVKIKGEKTGILEMRKHFAWYIKGYKNATKLKEKIFKLSNYSEVLELLQNID